MSVVSIVRLQNEDVESAVRKAVALTNCKPKASVNEVNTSDEDEGRYFINPITLKPIADALSNLNLVY